STQNTTIISTSTAVSVGCAGEVALDVPRRGASTRAGTSRGCPSVRVDAPTVRDHSLSHLGEGSWMPPMPTPYCGTEPTTGKRRWELIMIPTASALLALSILGAFAAQAVAYDPDAHDAKRFFADRDREAR